MKKIFLELGIKFDKGTYTCASLNKKRYVVEIHKSEFFNDIWCRLGKIQNLNVDWFPNKKIDKGQTPSISLNNNNQVIEIQKSEGKSLQK